MIGIIINHECLAFMTLGKYKPFYWHQTFRENTINNVLITFIILNTVKLNRNIEKNKNCEIKANSTHVKGASRLDFITSVL